jgi:hypothetical protein
MVQLLEGLFMIAFYVIDIKCEVNFGYSITQITIIFIAA